MSKIGANKAPVVPENMTGGTDLTDVRSLNPDYEDTLRHVGTPPDFMNTRTGGRGALHGSTQADGELPPLEDDPRRKREIHDLQTVYDPDYKIRLIPPSKSRPMRYTIAPGQTIDIAERNPARTACGLWITDALNGILLGYVGNDVGTVLGLGAELKTGGGGPFGIVLTHSDTIAFGAAAANATAVTVSVVYEFTE